MSWTPWRGFEKLPLHIRTAYALGWHDIKMATPMHGSGAQPEWMDPEFKDYATVPRYDTDWSAAGPLIERFKIQLSPPMPDSLALVSSHCEWVARAEEHEDGTFTYAGQNIRALYAVCNLILVLAAAGKLETK